MDRFEKIEKMLDSLVDDMYDEFVGEDEEPEQVGMTTREHAIRLTNIIYSLVMDMIFQEKRGERQYSVDRNLDKLQEAIEHALEDVR